MDISLIVAMANNRVIGNENQLPWHLPADLQHFKSVTLGKPIIMGRKTHESIGRALPGRRNIVVTHQQSLPANDIEVVHSVPQALSLVADATEVMIIGGAAIYEQALPLATTIYMTHVDASVTGDRFFPELDQQWIEVDRESHSADNNNPYDYAFVTLKKR